MSEEEIRRLLGGRPASILYAKRGRQNKALGIDPDALSEDEMIALMAREPTLIRRPTLVVDGAVLVQPKDEEIRRMGEGTGAP